MEPQEKGGHHRHHLEVSLHILQVLLQLRLDVVDVGSQAAQRALAPFCQGSYD